MEKRLVLVALVTLALGCGDAQGVTNDAGSDARVVGDEGVSEDAGSDADASQCVGEPDLSPCDDGRSHTTDACIDGECVGRTCTSVDTRCNTPRLTLAGCEGEPANEGVDCNDQDPFTTADECRSGACTGDPCPCPPGMPCCNDTCGFLGVETICAWASVVTCAGTCGGMVTGTTTYQRCSGVDAACASVPVTATEMATCTAAQLCEPGTLQTVEDERFGCLASPVCD